MSKPPTRWLCPSMQWGQHEIIQWSPYHSSSAQCQEPIWSPSKRWTCPSVKDPNRVAMLQWKMLSTPAMPQCKVVYPSQQINQPLLLVPKRKHLNIIHMNQNPRAPRMWMRWLCPSINQLKWLCSKINQSPSPKRGLHLKIICHLKNQPSMSRVSQCRVSSRVTVSLIKVLSEMAMPQYRVTPQLLIHHNPSENWLCLNARHHPKRNYHRWAGYAPVLITSPPKIHHW